MYYDFSFADYVGVALECNVCHVCSPEFRTAGEMVDWMDEHPAECNADL